MDCIVYLVLLASVVALGFAFFFFKQMMKESEGTETMADIALSVRKGAMAYLKQQYKIVLIVFVVLAVIFAVMAYFGLQNSWVPLRMRCTSFRAGRFLRNEDCDLRFGTYSKRRSEVA